MGVEALDRQRVWRGIRASAMAKSSDRVSFIRRGSLLGHRTRPPARRTTMASLGGCIVSPARRHRPPRSRAGGSPAAPRCARLSRSTASVISPGPPRRRRRPSATGQGQGGSSSSAARLHVRQQSRDRFGREQRPGGVDQHRLVRPAGRGRQAVAHRLSAFVAPPPTARQLSIGAVQRRLAWRLGASATTTVTTTRAPRRQHRLDRPAQHGLAPPSAPPPVAGRARRPEPAAVDDPGEIHAAF